MKNMIWKTELLTKVYLLYFLLMIGCTPFSENNIVGTYVSNIHRNSIDTLHIYKNHTYKHVIYDVDDKRLIHENTGTWKYSHGRIDFMDFIPNEDRKYKENLEYFWEEYKMLLSAPVRNYFGEMRIDINADLGHYYIKVKS